jgi:hypothetical protein
MSISRQVHWHCIKDYVIGKAKIRGLLVVVLVIAKSQFTRVGSPSRNNSPSHDLPRLVSLSFIHTDRMKAHFTNKNTVTTQEPSKNEEGSSKIG